MSEGNGVGQIKHMPPQIYLKSRKEREGIVPKIKII
jgi:hypothetical protein